MPICKNCQTEFPKNIKIDGHYYNLSGRTFCVECSPLGGRNTRSYIVELQENEAFCARCLKIKNKKEFYIRKDSGRTFSYCMECQKEVKNIKLQEKLERIVEEHGGCCKDCNSIFPPIIYEFYLDDNTYQISKIRNMSYERIKSILENYIILCPNCCALRKWVRLE